MSGRRLCIRGYADILRGLAREPATAAELTIRHGTSGGVMRGLVKRLYSERLIHIAGFRRATQGPAIRVFGFGDRPDATRPLTVAGRPSQHKGVTAGRPRPTPEVIAFASLMRALTEMRSLGELIEITGISTHSLAKDLAHMRSIGLIHIAGWERRQTGGGAPVRLYRVGIARKDAPRPQPQPRSEVNERHNAARRDRRLQFQLTRAICSNASAFNLAA